MINILAGLRAFNDRHGRAGGCGWMFALVMSEWSAEEVAPQHTGIKRFVEGTKSQVNFACV